MQSVGIAVSAVPGPVRAILRGNWRLNDPHPLNSKLAINLIQIQKWSFGMWETSPPAAPLLLKERFDKTLVPLLSKERLGEVLPDQTKLQFST